MYLLVCGYALSQIFCKFPLKALKERMHLIFTLDGLHFIYFKSKEHLELTFIYTVYFFFKANR